MLGLVGEERSALPTVRASSGLENAEPASTMLLGVCSATRWTAASLSSATSSEEVSMGTVVMLSGVCSAAPVESSA